MQGGGGGSGGHSSGRHCTLPTRIIICVIYTYISTRNSLLRVCLGPDAQITDDLEPVGAIVDAVVDLLDLPLYLLLGRGTQCSLLL